MDQVRRSPKKVAVTDGAVCMSYAELWDAVESLAAKLRAEGVRVGDFVPLATSRSIDGVLGLLAILRAGAAYVPIGPNEPDERALAIVEAVTNTVALASPYWAEKLNRADAKVISLTRDRSFAPLATDTFDTNLLDDEVAAVLFTSGTSGAPKGVQLSHSAIMARVRNGYPPRPHDVQKAPLNVVAHVSDLLVPLLCGGPVILVPDICVHSPRALADFIQPLCTDRLVFVPSQLSSFLEDTRGAQRLFSKLKSVIVSGEPLTETVVRRFVDSFPSIRLLNSYGACEVTGLACMGVITSPEDIHVGHPLGGCEVLVRDEAGRPVTAPNVGEVFCGGPQLARGYHNDVELTSRKFVSVVGDQGETRRLFRTGDLAQVRHDGSLRIVGRADSQKKIRGLVVNLNEIEAFIEALPGVRRAIVSADGDGSPRLLAHVVTTDPSVSSTYVREQVAARCAPQMVPHNIVMLDSLPLLPNGKVDRVRLATRPSVAPSNLAAAPARPTEQVLVEICQSVLGLTEVDIDADLLSLGGDSLDAERLVLEAEDHGLRITVSQLQQGLSIRQIARGMES